MTVLNDRLTSITVQGERKTLLAMQDSRRFPVCSHQIGADDSQSRDAGALPHHHDATLLERNPFHEDIVQAPVRLHPASAGPTVRPGASVRDISPVDQGTPLILERAG